MNKQDEEFIEELTYVFGKENVKIDNNEILVEVESKNNRFYLFVSIYNKYYNMNNTMFKMVTYSEKVIHDINEKCGKIKVRI